MAHVIYICAEKGCKRQTSLKIFVPPPTPTPGPFIFGGGNPYNDFCDTHMELNTLRANETARQSQWSCEEKRWKDLLNTKEELFNTSRNTINTLRQEILQYVESTKELEEKLKKKEELIDELIKGQSRSRDRSRSREREQSVVVNNNYTITNTNSNNTSSTKVINVTPKNIQDNMGEFINRVEYNTEQLQEKIPVEYIAQGITRMANEYPVAYKALLDGTSKSQVSDADADKTDEEINNNFSIKLSEVLTKMRSKIQDSDLLRFDALVADPFKFVQGMAAMNSTVEDTEPVKNCPID